MQGNLHAPFGNRTTEKDLHHRHLAGAPLHSASGLGKRTRRNQATAPQTDSTPTSTPTGRCLSAGPPAAPDTGSASAADGSPAAAQTTARNNPCSSSCASTCVADIALTARYGLHVRRVQQPHHHHPLEGINNGGFQYADVDSIAAMLTPTPTSRSRIMCKACLPLSGLRTL